jgi:SAM-dependent methyltransferase
MSIVDEHLLSEAGESCRAETTSCPACGSAATVDFQDCGTLPVHIGVLWDDPDQARNAPAGEVLLSYCRPCGFIFNRRYDARKIWFEPGFEVALHHSQVFRSFMEGVAERLIERFDLRHKNILEIGCGCGWFLRMLCQRGSNHGIGVDPTVPREGSEPVGDGSVRFIRDYFTEKYSDLPFDFICCLSVFEDIPSPQSFLQMVRRMIGGRPEVRVYFEIFNAFRAFEAGETWSINYEQCNYFSERSFTSLFPRCGFELLDAGPCYEGDQYLSVEAKPAPPSPHFGLSDPDDALPEVIARFGETHRSKINSWRRRLDEFQAARRRVVVWGSGGKGLNFLNALPTAGIVKYVVDINPDRQGKYVPGPAQKIVAPEFLADYRPDTVVLTNPLYEREIRQQVAGLGLACEFHCI